MYVGPGAGDDRGVMSTSIAGQLERQSVVLVESTIPRDMTCDQWRRRHSAPSRPVRCDHLHESTSRYDRVKKLLSFLVVCPVCRTEKVIETRHYEPRFERRATRPAAG